MSDLISHPAYPVRHGIPAMDRCTCGGVRHWHAVAPYGCDDCECTEFKLNEEWRPAGFLPDPRLTKEWLDGLIAEGWIRLSSGTILVENCLWCLTEFRDAILAATVESLPSESEPE